MTGHTGTGAGGPIAVVGIDCRFPGARDREEFWQLLLDGRVTAAPVDPRRWSADGLPDGAGTPIGFLDDADAFDHRFFGLSPNEAAAMDPQQRLLLQCAWRALEDSGVAPRSLAGSDTSVHVGMMSSEWGTLHLSDPAAMTAHRGSGNGYCMAANRISYHLDLRGPSMAVDTACSSSLVAVHLACTALRSGEVDTALAAGVNLVLTPALSVFYAQAGLAAPDGRCKPYSPDADGIGRGEGVGVVVLRRLADALAEGRRVYAVIDGGAVASDGRSNGLTAPNRFAQAAVVRSALHRSGVAPGDVTVVEGHGTGTRLGDLIELAALGDLHGDRPTPALVGSVKGNVGHLEGAAGIAGLVKTCLALQRRLVPASVGIGHDLAVAGLAPLTTATRLPAGTVRAGVSSFGLGGTNAHLVLSTPPRVRRPGGTGGDATVLVTGSATADGLARNVRALAAAATATPPGHAAQLGWSSTVVKSGLRFRAAVGAAPGRLADELDRLARRLDDTPPTPAGPAGPRVALLCTGQGSQYAGMTAALVRCCRPYRDHLADAADALGPLRDGDPDTRVDRLLTGRPAPDIDDTGLAQPALFAVQYAMGTTLAALGLRPRIVLGHSVGEIAAATLAGALTLDDAARLVRVRGAAMSALPTGGGMLTVRAGVDRVRAALGDTLGARDDEVVDLAADNGPQACVLSGTVTALDRIREQLRATALDSTVLTVSHAFHSALMAPAIEAVRAVADTLAVRPLQIPLASTVTGTVLPAGAVPGTEHWVGQLTGPVRFAEAAAGLGDPTHTVELGPRPVLTALVRGTGAAAGATALSCGPGPSATGAELAEVVARLHTDGLDVDWTGWFEPVDRVPRPLPGHVFDPTARFWFSRDAGATAVTATTSAGTATAPATDTAAPVPRGDLAAAVLAAIGSVSGHDPATVGGDAVLGRDLGYDSVMAMRLADELEPHVAAGLDPAALAPDLTTVADLIDHVRSAAGARTRGGVPT
ncbi:beta-ketoacyl synthase N-terminal-like domain-containing protein [Pseudonocardia tropica]|uniref:Beta-ketoacyl synthase N-terminal-like domain-containing protein n=1 Tax=Pseudonocardia tropica TaxID=681289 RepID=A0ABV1JVE5_9PSEU